MRQAFHAREAGAKGDCSWPRWAQPSDEQACHLTGGARFMGHHHDLGVLGQKGCGARLELGFRLRLWFAPVSALLLHRLADFSGVHLKVSCSIWRRGVSGLDPRVLDV